MIGVFAAERHSVGTRTWLEHRVDRVTSVSSRRQRNVQRVELGFAVEVEPVVLFRVPAGKQHIARISDLFGMG